MGNFNNQNTTGANFALPGDIAIDSAGNAWVANTNNHSVVELTSSGSLAGGLAPLPANVLNPLQLAIDASGNVWVTCSIQDFDSVVELIGAAHPVLTPQVACLARTPPHAVCLP